MLQTSYLLRRTCKCDLMLFFFLGYVTALSNFYFYTLDALNMLVFKAISVTFFSRRLMAQSPVGGWSHFPTQTNRDISWRENVGESRLFNH